MRGLHIWRRVIPLSIFASLVTVQASEILTNFSDLETQEFDFVVIGGLPSLFHPEKISPGLLGGTAGNVIANRLTENPAFSVLVIEAGGRYGLFS